MRKTVTTLLVTALILIGFTPAQGDSTWFVGSKFDTAEPAEFGPKIFSSKNGVDVAIWQTSEPFGSEIHHIYASRVYLNGYLGEQKLISTSSNIATPALELWDAEVSPDGRITIAYSEVTADSWTRDTRSTVFVRSTLNGITWTDPVVALAEKHHTSTESCLALGSCYYKQVNLEISPSGRHAVAASVTSAGNSEMYASASPDGATWQDASTIASSGRFNCLARATALASYSDGFVFVFKECSGRIRPRLLYSVWSNTTESWSGVKLLDQPLDDSNLYSTPGLWLTPAPSGGIRVLWWHESDNALPKLNYSSLRTSVWNPATDSWSQQSTVVGAPNVLMGASLVTSPTTGDTRFVWYEGMSGEGKVRSVKIVAGVLQPAVDVFTDSSLSFYNYHGATLQDNGCLSTYFALNATNGVIESTVCGTGPATKRTIADASVTDTYLGVGLNSSESAIVLIWQNSAGASTYRVAVRPRFTVTIVPNVVKYPVVKGVARVGQRLQLDRATFVTPLGSRSLVYQWFRCTKAVTSVAKVKPTVCSPITGATKNTYLIGKSDLKKYLVVMMGTAYSGGNLKAYSKSTLVVK